MSERATSEADKPVFGATARLAELATGGRFEDIPRVAREHARTFILDTLAVMLAGAAAEGTRILHRQAYDSGGRADAVIIGGGFRAPADRAALANGAAGHALDYDDTILFTSDATVYGTRLHPSTPVLAAALAVGEATGASGRDLLTAFVYGFEATCRLADAANRELYRRGYHPTGVIGPLGATVAAGRLLGLDRPALCRALGVAASCGGGLRENYGTMTKPLHAGRAAETGVVAAQLAARGFGASEQVLEGERGFYRAFAGRDGFEPARLLERFGDPFYVVSPGSAIKPYPTGSLTHPALDALFELIQEYDIAPDEVARVDVGSNSNLFGSLVHHEATTGLQAKFSIAACVALAMLLGRVGIAQLQDEVVTRPDVQSFMRRVTLYVHPEMEALGFDQPRAVVDVYLHDGRVLSRRADVAQGTTERPMSPRQLAEKVRDCAGLVLAADRVEELIELVGDLEAEPDLTRLTALLLSASVPVAGNEPTG